MSLLTKEMNSLMSSLTYHLASHKTTITLLFESGMFIELVNVHCIPRTHFQVLSCPSIALNY